jgi:transposase
MLRGISLDLNRIENLWAILKNSAHKKFLPKNRQKLETHFKNKWDALSLGLL